MRKYFFLLPLFVATLVQSQPLSSRAIDSLVERTLKAFDVPGIAVAVIKDGKVVHSKGYGVRSLATGQPVDENTLFGIASNSKAFTTAALGILVDEGKLNWDDKVRNYIPEFKMHDPYVTEEFTIRDLLTHRSGLGLGAGDLMFFPDSSDFTLKDILHNLQFLKPVSSFRSRYDYDNNMYIVAGEVIARVSGLSWDEFIKTRILQPLRMTHSAPSFDQLPDKSNTIDGHAPVEGKVRVIARSMMKVGHAAGGVNSSIADLSKWVLMQLSNGAYGANGTQRIFSDQVHREMWTPQTIIRTGAGPYNTHFASYGFGFGISDVRGYLQISHTGGLEGMVTQITMIPELNLGIIVLTNQQEGGAFTAITNQIKDAYLGIQGTDRVTEYSARRKTALDDEKRLTDSIWREIGIAGKMRAKETDLSMYQGSYKDPWFGEVVISIKEGKPWFDSKRSPKLTGEMFPYKGNSFVVKWRDRSMDADAYVIFSLNEEGRATGMTMKAISPLTDFSFDFQDLEFHRR
jgi:CubicO group peptidase (beta-lactamase class C family)